MSPDDWILVAVLRIVFKHNKNLVMGFVVIAFILIQVLRSRAATSKQRRDSAEAAKNHEPEHGHSQTTRSPGP